MIRTLIFLLLASVFSVDTGARNDQSELHQKYEKANAYLENGHYDKAKILYQELLKEEPENPAINYKLGLCYLQLNENLPEAAALLESSVEYSGTENKNSPQVKNALLALGRAYHRQYKFDSALVIFKELVREADISEIEKTEQLMGLIWNCENGKLLMNNPTPVNFVNPGSNINSELNDINPCIDAEESLLLYSVSSKKGEKPKLFRESQRAGDNWLASTLIYSDNFIDYSLVSLSPDGRVVFLNRQDQGAYNLYYSIKNGGEWSSAIKMGYPVNSEYDEMSASISPNNNVLYFSSNRPGGEGGFDIYESKKLPDGTWGKPINLGKTVNSRFNDNYPVYHPDTILYFSSEGHNSMGGYDIFTSQQASGKWAQPENIGYPVNTTTDDTYFIPALDNIRAYYSTHRNEDNLGQKDIYIVEMLNNIRSKMALAFANVNLNRQLWTEKPEVEVINTTLNRLEGIYKPDASGKYVFILPSDCDYQLFLKQGTDTLGKMNFSLAPKEAYSYLKGPVYLPEIEIQEKVSALPGAESVPEEPVLKGNYTIQLQASKQSLEIGAFEEIEGVRQIRGKDGWLRYITPLFETKEEAQERLNYIKNNTRFQNAYIRNYDKLIKL